MTETIGKDQKRVIVKGPCNRPCMDKKISEIKLQIILQ